MANHYDAIVVGAGPTGGWVAKTLTEAGMQVLVLEAGEPETMLRARLLVHRVRRRAGYRAESDPGALARQGIQSNCYAWPSDPAVFVDDCDNPYTTPNGQPFTWIRARQVGGRLAVPQHGLQFFRMSDFDFKAASRDGFGTDWPISYADLEPYYDRVEHFMGLRGNRDGIPHLPDPVATGPIALSRAEQHLADAISRRWQERQLIVRRTAPPPLPIKAARATGKVTLRCGAVARKILVDPISGNASGVSWVENGEEREASARVIALAASTIESTRLLLNSSCERHPNGLANSSGTLGKYLMDHTAITGIRGTFPAHVVARMPTRGPRIAWSYIPQFRNVKRSEPDFLRGYAASVFSMGAVVELTVFGEMLPREENRVTIDPVRRDRWGIPIPRIACSHSDNERAQAKDAIDRCREMLESAGCALDAGAPVLAPPGKAIHEVGTARMGSDPKTSVLDPYNRCWDVKNLFVVDGSCFVSQGVQNPTLTMMAIALRAAERIVSLRRRNEL
jgi:choline dehydrogenase-like flavoprotein